MGGVETAAFLLVAIPSAGKLDGLGLEFTAWNALGVRAATASVATGLLAGAIIDLVALCCHQTLGAESGWNGVVLAVILGPVVEEVVFRGYLMAAGLQLERRLFRKAGGWASVVGVALVFMFAHGARTGTTGIQLICIYDDRHSVRLHPTAAPIDFGTGARPRLLQLGPILELLDRYFPLTVPGLDARKLRDPLPPARTATGSGPTSVPREREIPRTFLPS
jgi:hypothetical protein